MPDAANRPADRPWLAWLLAFLAALTAARLALLLASGLDLYGDEAQYWTWSQAPDWGYFTKPPMIAWLIGASTALCGDGEWCVRAGAPLIHAATALAIHALARVLYGPRTGFWSAIIFATLPAVSLSSAVIATDAPLLLFWALALLGLVRLLATRAMGWALLTGAAIGLGMLSKYAMAYFLIGAGLFCLCTPSARWLPASRQGLAALAVAALVFLPNLIWNLNSGWATFAHLGDNANLKGELFNPLAAARFAAEQFAVFGPLPMAVLLWRLGILPRIRPAPADRLLLFFVLPVLAIVLAQAFLSRANANWAAPAYVGATIIVAAWAMRGARIWLARCSIGLHLAAALILGLFFLDLPGIRLPPDGDPLRKLRGWSAMAAGLRPVLERHPGHILLLSDRMTMASLRYYLREAPDAGRRRMAIWDWDGRPDNHYELVARYRPAPGDRLLLITGWPDAGPIIRQFDRVTALGEAHVPIAAGRQRVLKLYRLAVDGGGGSASSRP